MKSSWEIFLDTLAKFETKNNYVWTNDKQISSQWLIDKIIPGTKGVDVGGTEFLCQKLSEKGCDVVYYDISLPSSYTNYIQDDMLNILQHFEDNSLDFVSSRHTLEHSICPMFQLWAFNKILKIGGHLLLIVPHHEREWIWFNNHYNCLPYENWLMLFYRTGFKICSADAGSWKPSNSRFIEHRFDLSVETHELRLQYSPKWLPF
jgi:SAM-dependent methyltransferase